MYLTRAIEQHIRDIAASYPALVVTGPRQVGKSTLLEHLSGGDRTRVTLDRRADRDLAAYDPEAFFLRHEPPLLIDEIQYAPTLLEQVKIAIDEGAPAGSFWLTGSQALSVMEGVSESLAGRVGVVRLLGLSNAEIERRPSAPLSFEPRDLLERANAMPRMEEHELFARMVRGSMPRLYDHPELDHSTYYESYVETYLSRDVRDLAHVGDAQAFREFMGIAAAHTATSVNYATLASAVGVSAPTIRRWLAVLVQSGLVWLVPPFSTNALKRVVKSPRLYFTDTGLALHLMDMGAGVLERSGALAGQIFETWVVSEVVKGFLGAGRKPPVYFYRDAQNREIDLVIVDDGIVHPVEIKLAVRPKRAAKHFRVLDALGKATDGGNSGGARSFRGARGFGGARESAYVRGMGAVICMASEPSPMDEDVWYLPAWSI